MLTHYKKFLKSKLTFLVLVPIIAALLLSLGQKIYYQFQARAKLAELNNQVEILKKQKSDLENLISYYNQESNLEKEARLRLNLKKPGEKVIIILPQATTTGQESKLSLPFEAKSLPNWQQWWYYFFP